MTTTTHTTTSTATGVILTCSALDMNTVHVTGSSNGAHYTMVTGSEGGRKLVTITNTAPNSLPNAAPLARLELHGIRSDKLSLNGQPPIKLYSWLSHTTSVVHKFPIPEPSEHAGSYEWRRVWRAVPLQFELFAPGEPEPIVVVQKVEPGQHLPGQPQTTATMSLTARALPIQDWVVVSFLLVDREPLK
ncbi:hypothetical protein EXIGLDRAFT_722952 [Exidia glandulosa HHB12029]|uniref:DUF6593 domain-containing protein n=1 Tax=Exidia glandulosa HHB12029 TaxID=1314781 RepID=A0A165F1M1_EXIGL|nr:hypothetical protein EXIGLDRAFT_722952 [Exidia glandulosa HHB12029]